MSTEAILNCLYTKHYMHMTTQMFGRSCFDHLDTYYKMMRSLGLVILIIHQTVKQKKTYNPCHCFDCQFTKVLNKAGDMLVVSILTIYKTCLSSSLSFVWTMLEFAMFRLTPLKAIKNYANQISFSELKISRNTLIRDWCCSSFLHILY